MARIVQDLSTNAIAIGNAWVPANQHEEQVAKTMLRRMTWALARALAARDQTRSFTRYLLEMMELGFIKVPEAVNIIREVNNNTHLDNDQPHPVHPDFKGQAACTHHKLIKCPAPATLIN